VLAQILDEFPDQVRIVYRHYPLIGTPEQPFHDKAALATQAAEAAGKQGMFWEMHDLLYQKQDEWVSLSVDQFEEWLVGQADELGLDVEQFSQDLTSDELVQLAQNAWETNQQTGLPGTPFLLVNGQIWPNNVPMDLWSISAVTRLTLLESQQYTSCPPITIDTTKQYIATIETEKGDIVLELYALEAPLAVNSFVFLARNGWFDGVTFHRVIEDFMAQAGDPTGTGFGGPGYAFDNEISDNLKFDKPGVLAMANAGAGSNGSQFFITYSPQPRLDGDFTIFGGLIDGMDVLKSLTPRNPSEDVTLPPGDKILNITIEEK
jgi:cyclophilin family peptidyl-prolyl cis-trans isomerase